MWGNDTSYRTGAGSLSPLSHPSESSLTGSQPHQAPGPPSFIPLTHSSPIALPESQTRGTDGAARLLSRETTPMAPPPLRFHPPLLNTACPWATTEDDIRALLCCPSTGAVTTRTSLLDGFAHDDAVHRYTFIDSSGGALVSADDGAAESKAVGSVNSLGYSPIPLDGYIAILQRLSSSVPATVTRKTIIISVTGEPGAVAKCYTQISLAAQSLPFPLAMEVNLSCPNIPGSPPPAYNYPFLATYLAALPSDPVLPVGIKLPPFTYAAQFTSLVETLQLRSHASRVSFITATNTLGSCLVFDGDVGDGVGKEMLQGGMAGAPLHLLALGNVKTLRRLLDQTDELRHVVIIGVGGVSDGAGYRRMRRAGATSVGLATGLGSKGVRVFENIERDVKRDTKGDVAISW